MDSKGDRIVIWSVDGKEFDAVICDLSLGGCFLNTAYEASVGQKITIRIPTYKKQDETILTFSARVIPQERPLAGFGVSFEDLDEKQEVLILRLLQTFESVPDRRSKRR